MAKNILAPLRVTGAASAIDAGIQNKIHGSGRPSDSVSQKTTLIISNDELNNIRKIVQALKGSGISLKGVTKTIKNEAKEQKGGFLGMLLSNLGASLLGNMLTEKEIIRGCGNKMNF